MLESCCAYLLKLLSYSWKVKCCTVYQWRGGRGGTPLFGLTVAMFGPMVYRDTYTYGEFNPLGPKSDQYEFSPNNISRQSRVKVMRITKLITKGRML